jgi:AcrR family transcriptional regulator
MMSIPADRRSRKRLATRQNISKVATRLFLERGFDQVTVDEVAKAADVGRMTVFNYFPRKEDMFFDRDEEGRELLIEALRQRAADVSPIEALRRLAHRLVTEHSPFVEFSADSHLFLATVEASETLKARARAIRNELTQALTEVLAECVGRDPADADAYLAVSLAMATGAAALLQAHRVFRLQQDSEQATAVFLSMVEKGVAGLNAALADTPYV